MNTKAIYTTVGNATAWFAYRGFKVLCDRSIRARRFKSGIAALEAGEKASDDQFY